MNIDFAFIKMILVVIMAYALPEITYMKKQDTKFRQNNKEKYVLAGYYFNTSILFTRSVSLALNHFISLSFLNQVSCLLA